jgi:carbon storage regulator
MECCEMFATQRQPEHRQTKEFNMLVLSRKKDENIIIGDNICITVVEIGRDKVRLGIVAPGIIVHRSEVYEAIRRDRALGRQTSQNTPPLSKKSGMLILSRHRDESIIIGDDIVLTVVDIRGDKARLGISAPIDINVHRQEVYEAIQRESHLLAGDIPEPPQSHSPDATGNKQKPVPNKQSGSRGDPRIKEKHWWGE